MAKQNDNYVDGFVFVVKKKDVSAYKKMAKEGAKAWMKHGALDYKECMGDDLTPESHGDQMSSFPKLTKQKPEETVWFSFITFKSKAHRNQVNKKVMKEMDEKYADAKNFSMPFDTKRMSYGGFKVVVNK
ncbi:MAG: DUF1428 domain-containing protein [Minisyncoccota bacterium]